jgi:hypothetical protein
MKRFLRHLIASILCRCPNCWEPLACQRHWVGNIEGYGNYYCPKCSGMKVEEGQDVYS